MRFKAVAFDVDGTLYPASAINRLAAPLVLRHPLAFAAFGAARRDIRAAALRAEYRASPPADGASFRLVQARMTASLLSGRLRPAAGREAYAERIGQLIEATAYRGVAELFSGISPYPGLVPALDALAGAGLRLAALSDLPPERKLELLGLGGRFEAALCAEDSGFLKPAAAPFAMLCSALGLRPSEILYVGNSVAYDLVGATGAGMEAAIVSRRTVPGAALSFFDWGRLVDFALS